MASRSYVHLGSKVIYHIVGATGRFKHLGGYKYDVYKLAHQHEAECAELEQSDGVVAEVEAIGAEHSEKDGQE